MKSDKNNEFMVWVCFACMVILGSMGIALAIFSTFKFLLQ